MESSNFLSNVGGCLLYLYGIISQIMTIVFFIGYCRTDSILEIIFIDGQRSTMDIFYLVAQNK